MVITSLYAGLLALFFVVLSGRVIQKRVRINLGDGGDADMFRRIRAHANFAEYVPLVLILLALAEWGGTTPTWLLHAIGLALLVGRVLHGIALAFTAHWVFGRAAGILLTFLALIVGAGICVWRGLAALLI